MQGSSKQLEPTENKSGSPNADGDPWAFCAIQVPESIKTRAKALANGAMTMEAFRGSCIYRDQSCPDCLACPYGILTHERVMALQDPPEPEPAQVDWHALAAKIEDCANRIEHMNRTVNQLAVFLQHFAELTQQGDDDDGDH